MLAPGNPAPVSDASTQTDLGIINANLTNGNQSGTFKVAAATLGVTATGAAGAAVTLTLPAVAANFHYISHIEIVAYTTLARVGTATPVLVTSTNLPGSPVWDFPTATAIGTVDRYLPDLLGPVKSSVANTATTIVCPATTSIIWRVLVFYYAGV